MTSRVSPSRQRARWLGVAAGAVRACHSPPAIHFAMSPALSLVMDFAIAVVFKLINVTFRDKPWDRN